jgi:hypothetical protein
MASGPSSVRLRLLTKSAREVESHPLLLSNPAGWRPRLLLIRNWVARKRDRPSPALPSVLGAVPSAALRPHELLGHLHHEVVAYLICIFGRGIDGDREIAATQVPACAAAVLRDVHSDGEIHIEADVRKPARHLVEVALRGGDDRVGARRLRSRRVRRALLKGVVVLEVVVGRDSSVAQTGRRESHDTLPFRHKGFKGYLRISRAS